MMVLLDDETTFTVLFLCLCSLPIAHWTIGGVFEWVSFVDVCWKEVYDIVVDVICIGQLQNDEKLSHHRCAKRRFCRRASIVAYRLGGPNI